LNAVEVNELIKPGVIFNENMVHFADNKIITNVLPVKLFFLTKNRNAWHAIKINRFDKKSFFLSLKDAELAAESRRKNGTSFLIKEIPGLFFDFENYYIFIVQINTNQPLLDYSKTPTLNGLFSKNDSDFARYNFDFKGRTGLDVLNSFLIHSNNWIRRPLESEYVLSIFEFGEYPHLCRLHIGVPLITYQSKFLDGATAIEWNPVCNDINFSHIISLSEELHEKPRNNVLKFQFKTE
jgi:hypothetical protein